MKINSDTSMAVARQTFRQFGGSWTRMREHAERDENGVLVVKSKPNGN